MVQAMKRLLVNRHHSKKNVEYNRHSSDREGSHSKKKKLGKLEIDVIFSFEITYKQPGGSD